MTTRSTRSPRRRTVVALAVVLALLAVFVLRLVDIQVVNAKENVANSLKVGNIGGTRILIGTRGDIVDSTGVVLAHSTKLYDAEVTPVNVKTVTRPIDGKLAQITWADAAAKIAQITGQSVDDVMGIVTSALAKDPGSQFAYLKRGISTGQYRDLVALNLPYLNFESQPSRTYPNGAVAGNLTGFVGMDGTALAGLELADNACLTPTAGSETFQRGRDGVIIPGTLASRPAVDGGTLGLTIDADLQWYLQQLIAQTVQDQGAKSGTITVAEVGTGDIRAAAEYPSVDPNAVGATAAADRGSRIFQNSFEPGSTFKPLTAASLIDTGSADLTTTVQAPMAITFPNGAKVRDAESHPVNNYTLTGVLIDSSNVGISLFSQKESVATRYDYLKRFGIASGSAIQFGGQGTGYLGDPTKLDNQTIYNSAFGQGVTTTVPELVDAYLTIANGGVRLPLRLVDGCTKPDGTVVRPAEPAPQRVLSASTATAVTSMLENVYNDAQYAKFVRVPGYRVAIKSGTGEKADGHGGYKRDVYFTTMIGFAPADHPRFVVAVTLDEPTRMRSSMANASAFQQALIQVLKTYRVLPSTSPAPHLPKFG